MLAVLRLSNCNTFCKLLGHRRLSVRRNSSKWHKKKKKRFNSCCLLCLGTFSELPCDLSSNKIYCSWHIIVLWICSLKKPYVGMKIFFFPLLVKSDKTFWFRSQEKNYEAVNQKMLKEARHDTVYILSQYICFL